MALVLFGDGDDEPEVGPDELVERGLVPLLDPLGEFDLLLGRQERGLPDLLEILVQHPLTAGDVHWRFLRVRVGTCGPEAECRLGRPG